jgi:hypothetical protein
VQRFIVRGGERYLLRGAERLMSQGGWSAFAQGSAPCPSASLGAQGPGAAPALGDVSCMAPGLGWATKVKRHGMEVSPTYNH